MPGPRSVTLIRTCGSGSSAPARAWRGRRGVALGGEEEEGGRGRGGEGETGRYGVKAFESSPPLPFSPSPPLSSSPGGAFAGSSSGSIVALRSITPSIGENLIAFERKLY